MKRPTPEEYEQTIERLLKYAPVEFQNNQEVRDTARVFLEVGGETLARQYLEVCHKPFPDKLTLFERPPEDETLKDGAEDQGEENEDID